jgi:hypothetical protein
MVSSDEIRRIVMALASSRTVTNVNKRKGTEMLRVTVEIWPAGVAEFRRTLGIMNVANVSNLADVSCYSIYASEGENRLAGTKSRTCHVTVRDHDRRQSVWTLIGAAIREMEGAEFDGL